MIWRLVKLILGLGILAVLGVIAFAYIGPVFFPQDFAAPAQTVTEPVTLDLD